LHVTVDTSTLLQLRTIYGTIAHSEPRDGHGKWPGTDSKDGVYV
jgi:hypothetical protein